MGKSTFLDDLDEKLKEHLTEKKCVQFRKHIFSSKYNNISPKEYGEFIKKISADYSIEELKNMDDLLNGGYLIFQQTFNDPMNLLEKIYSMILPFFIMLINSLVVIFTALYVLVGETLRHYIKNNNLLNTETFSNDFLDLASDLILSFLLNGSTRWFIIILALYALYNVIFTIYKNRKYKRYIFFKNVIARALIHKKEQSEEEDRYKKAVEKRKWLGSSRKRW